MKKGIFALLTMTVIFLSACSSPQRDFEKALQNMNELKSFRADISYGYDLSGGLNSYIIVQDDELYISDYLYEAYELYDTDTRFTIETLLDGKYAIPIESEAPPLSHVFIEFNSEDFTQNDDGVWISNRNYSEISNVEVELFNGYIDTISAKYDNGFTYDIVIEYSGLDNTTVDFPQYEFMSERIEVLVALDELDYRYRETEFGYELEKGWIISIVIEYVEGNDYLHITDNYSSSIEFYPSSRIVKEGVNTVSLQDYLDASPLIDEEIFDLLIDLYHADD